ncbi:Formate hydrogenlyase subunit 4 [Raineyella antarctica]|uniref:Formate hydrogenlyase subunit 4 n=1 Tax=Raineyella antarctica TaxID=1577474 RepID=A0A1G6GEU1_9ACTN|nr:Formate hydrogenlyase subunit 4 [Raineyella antarctica]
MIEAVGLDSGVIDSVLVIVTQLVLAIAVTPLLIGVMRTTRARLEGRVGGGIGQPWRDVAKLLSKEPLRAPGSTPVLTTAPILLVASSLLLCALVPLVSTLALASVPGDLFVVVSVLLLGTVALALLGLESGTAFGGMGSSRHMTIAALVEPTVLLSIYALSVPTGTSALASIVQARKLDPTSLLNPVSLLSIVALVVVVIAETGRLPVDNPSTHLELTMVHEAMILESGGRDLGWLEFGSWLRLTALLGLVVNLAMPWGVAADAAPLGLLVGLVTITAKLLVTGALLAAAEVFMAKLRLFRVPELLAGSFVLAFLSVSASYLVF